MPVKLKKKQKKLNPSNKIRIVDPVSPDPAILLEAAEIIRKGGIVVFPTRCLYGLAADALNPEAVAGIFSIKKRPSAKPILVLIKSQDALLPIVQEVPLKARQLMKLFWPGKLTIIFSARQTLPKVLTGNTAKIGVRLPGHPVAQALTRLLDNPITGTSANLSGHPGVADVRHLEPPLLQKVDLVLDAGPLLGGAGSTVVEITQNNCTVIREGVISKEQIFAAFQKNELNSD